MVYAYLFLFIACQEILRSRSLFYLTTCDLFESLMYRSRRLL